MAASIPRRPIREKALDGPPRLSTLGPRRRRTAVRTSHRREATMDTMTVNPPNLWRLETPGHEGWTRTARPGDARKYFIVSADEHVNEPATLWFDRMDKQYQDRLPRVVTDERGVQWRVCEGYRPDRLRLSELEGEDLLRSNAGADPLDRLRDMDRDGIDASLLLPNKSLAMWAPPHPP